MNTKSLKILEFDKVIEQLSAHASTDGGRALCKGLLPMTDPCSIDKALNLTNEALQRIWAKGSISFSGVRDISISCKRLEIGSVLSQLELMAISSTLDTASRAATYGKADNNSSAAVTYSKALDNPSAADTYSKALDNPSAADTYNKALDNTNAADCNKAVSDSLDALFAQLTPLFPLNSEIKRCIISDDEISDDASPALKAVRRQIRNINDRIHTQLTELINSQTVRSCLQEAVITTRNGRYCIPVKSEYKSQIPGMVHDQSSTGSTFFIEPMSIVKLNNELREAELSEKEEIEKILAALSELAAQYVPELMTDYHTLVQLDFIFSKASFAKQTKSTRPEINTNGYLNFKKARHPLIDSKKVVPIDIYLGDAFSSLIITGPNTGGKTVTLKTVGLLTIMGQCGLNIPAFEGSTLAVFNEIFADIGDEQSIEQSLSTFSSHMTNIVRILKDADSNSLVLFDELCAGTDPTEGAALATSILDSLLAKKIRTIATTHYSELKLYALSQGGVANACCEFDVETLSPTYRLLIGIPGKSNAFAISSKLGLTEDIIKAAGERINTNDKAFEDLIADLEKSRVTIEREREEIAAYKLEIESLKKRLQEKNDKIDEKRDKILKDANEKAAAILRDAKDTADESIKLFNKKGITAREMEEQRSKIRQKKEKNEAHLALKNTRKAAGSYAPADFKIGTSVHVLSLNLDGTVTTLPNTKGDLFVQMGILRSQVNIKDLDIIKSPDNKSSDNSKKNMGQIKMDKTLSISPEINLIGQTVDEATVTLDKYLDDAYLSGIPQVRVVHGKGAGILRAAVHNQLKRTSYVKSFRLGVYGEGEAGVTIVDFK